MLDVLLLCPGETATLFDLALGLDREYPMQTALGLVTATPTVAVDRGPPHVGQEGWLFHLDAPSLLLSSFRPAVSEGSLTGRLLECSGHALSAELRCVRDPTRAALVDAQGTAIAELSVQGDAVVAAELTDGLLADLGLPEAGDDRRLAEPALVHRIRSLGWADSTISGGPVFGGQVSCCVEVHHGSPPCAG